MLTPSTTRSVALVVLLTFGSAHARVVQEPDMNGFSAAEEKLYRLHPHEAYNYCAVLLDQNVLDLERYVNPSLALSTVYSRNDFDYTDSAYRASTLEKIPQTDPTQWRTHLYLPSGRVSFDLPKEVGAAKRPYAVPLPPGIVAQQLLEFASDANLDQSKFLVQLKALKTSHSMVSYDPSNEVIEHKDKKVSIPHSTQDILKDPRDFANEAKAFETYLEGPKVSIISAPTEYDLSDQALKPLQNSLKLNLDRLSKSHWRRLIREVNAELEQRRISEVQFETLIAEINSSMDQLSKESRGAIETLWGKNTSPSKWTRRNIRTKFTQDRYGGWTTSDGERESSLNSFGNFGSFQELNRKLGSRSDKELLPTLANGFFVDGKQQIPSDVMTAATILIKDEEFLNKYRRLAELSQAKDEGLELSEVEMQFESLAATMAECARSLSLSPSSTKEHLEVLIALQQAQHALVKESGAFLPPRDPDEEDSFYETREEFDVTSLILKNAIAELEKKLKEGAQEAQSGQGGAKSPTASPGQ